MTTSRSESQVGRRFRCLDRETGDLLYVFEVTAERVGYLDIRVLEGPERSPGSVNMVDRHAVLRGANAHYRFEPC